MRAVAIALVSVLCAAQISPASAQGQGQGKGQSEGHGKGHQGQGQGQDQDHGQGAAIGPHGQQIAIQDRDRETVHSWYRNEYAAGRCPPGLARKNNGCLPPGQAKKMWNLGEPLPPQVPYYPIPRELAMQLAPPPPGYEYVRVDNDILLMSSATRLVSGLLGNLGAL